MKGGGRQGEQGEAENDEREGALHTPAASIEQVSCVEKKER